LQPVPQERLVRSRALPDARVDPYGGSTSGVAVHSGEYSTLEVAELFGVGRSTVYRAIERQRIAAKAKPGRITIDSLTPVAPVSHIRHLSGHRRPIEQS
jgi:excisionase family DNA binding protein